MTTTYLIVAIMGLILSKKEHIYNTRHLILYHLLHKMDVNCVTVIKVTFHFVYLFFTSNTCTCLTLTCAIFLCTFENRVCVITFEMSN